MPDKPSSKTQLSELESVASVAKDCAKDGSEVSVRKGDIEISIKPPPPAWKVLWQTAKESVLSYLKMKK